MTDNLHEFFNEGFAAEAGEDPGSLVPPPPPSRREARRQRKRRKRRAWMKWVVAILVVAVLVGAGWAIVSKVRSIDVGKSQQSARIVDYPGPGGAEVQFTVSQGQSTVEIGDNLEKAGIVATSAAFQQAVVNVDAGAKLQPGTFTLKLRMKSADVVKVITDPKQAQGFLQVRAGERVSDVVTAAAELTDFSKDDFQKLIDAKGDGILPAEAGGSFEGWLEPGTYDVKSMKSVKEIMKTMVDKRIAKLDQLGVPGGDQRERILKVASIAEAEVNKESYYGKVTRVIENRLAQDMTLGMDSTVAYGNGVAPSKLTQAMLDDAGNPYNTRQNKGLPPTPISNPGDSAIKAAMNPESGDWLYFVTVDLNTGETKFTNSSDEFEKYVQELRAWESANDS